MNAIKLFPLYIRWHYTTAFVDMLRIDGNIFWFFWHFFSVPDTFRTFFSPWERMGERYEKTFDVANLASTFVVNTLMRIVGIFMRSILLFFALVSFIVVAIVLVAVFFIWIFLPFFLLMLAFFGISALFN